jgi:hypothetical protein
MEKVYSRLFGLQRTGIGGRKHYPEAEETMS